MSTVLLPDKKLFLISPNNRVGGLCFLIDYYTVKETFVKENKGGRS